MSIDILFNRNRSKFGPISLSVPFQLKQIYMHVVEWTCTEQLNMHRVQCNAQYINIINIIFSRWILFPYFAWFLFCFSSFFYSVVYSERWKRILLPVYGRLAAAVLASTIYLLIYERSALDARPETGFDMNESRQSTTGSKSIAIIHHKT